MRFWVFLIFLTTAMRAMAADDCLAYKITPRVDVRAPDWTKTVVQPLVPMDLLHGDVVATLVDNYDITADITGIEDGFCVSLKQVQATIGYSDFNVAIDVRHTPNGCAYNAILSHEDEHIRAYLSVIEDLNTEMHDAIYTAADSVTPVFVRDASEIDRAVDTLNTALQSHAEIILMRQKIRAAEEIRNKHVDTADRGDGLKRCFE